MVYDLATQRHAETWTGTSYASAISDIKYGYNSMGELASVTVLKENGQTPAAVASSTQYDAIGGTSTTTLPNTVYTYDAGGRLETTLDSATGITTKYTYKPDTNYVQEVKTTNSSGTVLADDSHSYRNDGLKTGAIKYTLNADGSSDTVTLTWNYDGLDRLTSETSSDTAGVAALNYTDEYKYDLNSNRTTETIENGSGTVTDTVTSTYNADNQLTQSVDANNGTTVFSYDLDGNQIETVHTPSGSTTPDSTTTSEYTLQGKLAGIQNKNGSGTVTSSAAYIYDDQGNRIEVTTVTGTNSPVRTYFLVDGNNPTGYAQVIEQSATPGTPAITYIWGETLIQQDNAAGTPNAGTYYLIADAHGSTQLLVNASGGVVQDYYYDGFGNAIGFTVSSAITQYLYDQQFFDIVSGQYYMRARNYDPATGTFTQQDSYTINAGDLANANLYLYAGGDPVNMFDPSGKFGSALSLSVTLTIGSLVDSISLPAIGGAFAYVGSAVLAGTVAYEASTWLWSTLDIPSLGTVGDEIYNTLRSDTQAVAKAIDDVAAKLDIAVQDLQKFKVFPIIRRFGPNIYAFDTWALAKNPSWYELTYNGPYSPKTIDNRAAVYANYRWQMATAPAGYQLDEFPYASTVQGGPGAYGEPVPALQNLVQGGLLSAFYRYALESEPLANFIVVPIPL